MRLSSVEEYLYVHATKTPEKIAVVTGERETDYRTLYEKALSFSTYLKESGVSKGDIVVTRAEQNLNYVVIYLAIHMAGGIVTSLEKNIPLTMLMQIAKQIGAKFLLLKEDEKAEGWKNLYYSEAAANEKCRELSLVAFPNSEETADI